MFVCTADSKDSGKNVSRNYSARKFLSWKMKMANQICWHYDKVFNELLYPVKALQAAIISL